MKQFWKDAIKDLPFHKITVKMLKNMYYGQDLKLGDKWIISLHSEDDMYDIRLNWDYPDGEGDYLYGITWDWDTDLDESIEFEQAFNKNVTPLENKKMMEEYVIS